MRNFIRTPGWRPRMTYHLKKLYKRGYRGIIFDIDNTLVPHGAPADARAEELFARLKEIGFVFALISNNKGPRVQMFNENIHAYTVCDAHKPSPENYLKAAALWDVPKEKVLFIGDQILQTFWGARLAGIYSILASAIQFPKEEIQSYLNENWKNCFTFIKRNVSEKKTVEKLWEVIYTRISYLCNIFKEDSKHGISR